MMNSPVALVALTLVSILVYRIYFKKNTHLPFPPGPKPLPIFGNVGDFPREGVPEYQHWLKHKDVYGPISSVTVMGQTIVIIHDKQAAIDILDKKALASSTRPRMEFASNLCGFGEFIVGLKYCDEFRRHRKLMHQQLGTTKLVSQFDDTQQYEVSRLLLRLLDDPRDAIKHMRTEAGAIILKATYGYSIGKGDNDPLVALINRMMDNFSAAFVAGRWMVDLIPMLQYIPEFVPGMSFKRTARKWKRINEEVVNVPYRFVQRQVASGNYRQSYVSKAIQQQSNSLASEEPALSAQVERDIKYTAGAMYAGASDTTTSSMGFFLLAMALFPEVQRKAQKEIDSVTSMERLPGFQDRHKLPYVEGVVKEALRWTPVAPMGVAHVTESDIIYGGYLIPNGAYLLPAQWWFLHDPDVYSHPASYDPERYLEPRNEPDPSNIAFGFGRRVCPGRYLADSNLYLNIAQILAVFNIGKPLDEAGEELKVTLDVTPGIIAYPVQRNCRITPRTAKLAQLVRDIEIEQPWEKSDAEHLDYTGA